MEVLCPPQQCLGGVGSHPHCRPGPRVHRPRQAGAFTLIHGEPLLISRHRHAGRHRKRRQCGKTNIHRLTRMCPGWGVTAAETDGSSVAGARNLVQRHQSCNSSSGTDSPWTASRSVHGSRHGGEARRGLCLGPGAVWKELCCDG